MSALGARWLCCRTTFYTREAFERHKKLMHPEAKPPSGEAHKTPPIPTPGDPCPDCGGDEVVDVCGPYADPAPLIPCPTCRPVDELEQVEAAGPFGVGKYYAGALAYGIDSPIGILGKIGAAPHRDADEVQALADKLNASAANTSHPEAQALDRLREYMRSIGTTVTDGQDPDGQEFDVVDLAIATIRGEVEQATDDGATDTECPARDGLACGDLRAALEDARLRLTAWDQDEVNEWVEEIAARYGGAKW